jgi:hypothetical protein
MMMVPCQALKHSNGVALQLSPAVAVAVAPPKAEGNALEEPSRQSLLVVVERSPFLFFLFLQVTWAGLY